MHRLWFAVLIGSSLAVAGCATMQSIGVDKRSRVFHAPFDTVIVATAEYCNDRGFPVSSVDRVIGILNTEYRENDGTSKFFFGNYRAKINFQFKRVGPDATRVVANVSAEEQGMFGTYKQSTLTESQATKTYADIFTQIQAKLPPGTPPPSMDGAAAAAALPTPEDLKPGKTPRLKLLRSSSVMNIEIISETDEEIVYRLAGDLSEGRALKIEIDYIVMPDGSVRRFPKPKF